MLPTAVEEESTDFNEIGSSQELLMGFQNH